ncbi:MAG: hypothetical protein JO208_01450, partial [Alphaproteobacteria bacterium]|nr:hypothetical protein [Alphaproteobacteria bacterium]
MKRICTMTLLATAGAAMCGGMYAAADDLDALSRDDKQWVMPAKNYASTRFS